MIESRRGEEEAVDGLSLKATFLRSFDVAPSAFAAAPEPGRVIKIHILIKTCKDFSESTCMK